MQTTLQFLSLPNADPATADVLILPVSHEKTVTYNKGTAEGPRAILQATAQLEFYEEDKRWCPAEHLAISVLPMLASDAEETDQAFHKRLLETVKQQRADALFVGLGGEHSITPDMVLARMPAGGTIVQIDAHADFREQYHGSIYNHACPMYRLRQHGYQLIQIGIRSLHANEAHVLQQDSAITTWFDRQLQQPQQWQQLLQQLENLQGDVWLTMDMDGFDPALIPGVGTPQPGGLGWHQGLDILEALTDNKAINLVGVDLVEMIPDPACVSDMMAAKLLQKCISYWGKSRGFDSRPKQGSQTGAEDD